MSYAGDTRSERIANQILSWMRQTNFEAAGPSDVNRLLEGFDLVAEIDPNLSASANWEIIKDRLGLVTQSEFDELLAGYDTQSRKRVHEEIRSQTREYGLEAVVDALAGNPVPEALRERVDDVLDGFPPDVYDAVLVEEMGVLLDVLGDDFAVIDRERLDQLQREAQRPGRSGDQRDEVLHELSRAFGQHFDDVGEAVRTLQERIASARGERLRIAPIEARRSGEDVLVRIVDGSLFDRHTPLVRRRARRLIAFPPGEPATWTEIGEIAVRNDEVERIDFTRGETRYGVVEDLEDVPTVETFETAQSGLPTQESLPGDDLARRAIERLEGV